MKTIRIQSTRPGMVVLPPANHTEDDRKAGKTYFDGRQVHPMREKDQPAVTIIPGAYWDTIKDRPDVKNLFTVQEGVEGQLKILADGDTGPMADASRPLRLPDDDGEALITIAACDDIDRLMSWASSNPNRTPVLAALSRKIAIVESRQGRGMRGKLEGASASAE